MTIVEKFTSDLVATLQIEDQQQGFIMAEKSTLDQRINERWIMLKGQCDLDTKHRPRTQHGKSDGLSKKIYQFIERPTEFANAETKMIQLNFFEQESNCLLPLCLDIG